MSPVRSPRRGRYLSIGSLGVTGLGIVLLSWPPSPPDVELPTDPTPFRWDADGLFAELEGEFRHAGDEPEAASVALDELEREARALLAPIAGSDAPPLAALDRLATVQLRMAVQGAAHPALLPRVLDLVVEARVAVMRAAARWPLDRPAHEALYRVVFGGRIALEEALAQAGPAALPELVPIEDLPGETPSIVVEGVRVHSGDILLSRGGAPTSALIARGNDFPNTFSHAALAHVDAATGEGTVIESLIEAGSVLSSVDRYLESKKHRIWALKGSMSAPGLTAWLADMGVREFTTLVPSDLEYDPQVRAVAEWRNGPALMDYRLDNAITDVLLEEAEAGARLGYAPLTLPAARLLKAYSVARSLVGAAPTIPSGMSAATALRVDALVSDVHPAVKDELLARAAAFRESNGYEAPYWTLVALAREALTARGASLAPALSTP